MSEVILEVQGHLAIITLAAPERRNALVPSMVEELLQACDEVDANLEVGAVVVRALGKSFCAGAHRSVLAEAGEDPPSPDSFSRLRLIYRAFTRVAGLGPPTVAAVRGHAVGAGVNLMLSTDLRIVSEDAQISAGFLPLGLHPGGGHYTLMGRSAGREATAAISLFGQPVDGPRAVELGVAWAAYPEQEVEPEAIRIASVVAADPELAREAAKSFRLEMGPPMSSWSAAIQLETGMQMWSLQRRQAD
jgi:enoyl-CoA hydratase